jgi:hypothetical protein
MGIFKLNGTKKQNAIIQQAIDRCTFPWDLLLPGLKKAKVSAIQVTWEKMGSGTLGWASPDGQIAINRSISGDQAQSTFLLEFGHQIDFFYLTPAMRKAIFLTWHPEADKHQWFGNTVYWSQVGEAFSALVPWMFADKGLWIDAGYTHKPTKQLATKIKAILLAGKK